MLVLDVDALTWTPYVFDHLLGALTQFENAV